MKMPGAAPEVPAGPELDESVLDLNITEEDPNLALEITVLILFLDPEYSCMA